MLFSTNLTIGGQEFTIKLGMKELITIKNKGINISKEEHMSDIENILSIFHTGIQMKANKISFGDLIDLIDNSDITFEAIAECVKEALSLGLSKKSIKEENKDNKGEEEGKN